MSADTVEAELAGAGNGSSALGRVSGEPGSPTITSRPSLYPNEPSCSAVYGSQGSDGPTTANCHRGVPDVAAGPIHVSVLLFPYSARMPLTSGWRPTSTIWPSCR